MRTKAARLRWIQFGSAGIDAAIRHGVPTGVMLTNAGSAWAPTVAEHAFALLLGLARKLHDFERLRAAASWQRDTMTDTVSSLDGGRLLVLGFGPIGREVSRRADAFGMRTIAIATTPRDHPLVERVAATSDLAALLPAADAIVIALPLTPATRHLISSRELSLCKRSALIVNVARGAIIDSVALLDALMSDRIGGAGLDVFPDEPLPADNPL